MCECIYQILLLYSSNEFLKEVCEMKFPSNKKDKTLTRLSFNFVMYKLSFFFSLVTYIS